MNIQIIHDISQDQLVTQAAEKISAAISHAWQEGRDAHVVLTGGRTGLAIAQALDINVYRIRTNASDSARLANLKLHVWFSDERYVDRSADDRLEKVIESGFVSTAESTVFHAVPSPSEGALVEVSAQYDAEILGSLGSNRFDGVILSMGEDGHVASCFPGDEKVLTSRLNAVEVTNSPKPPAERTTLTLHRLAQTSQVYIFVIGEGKRTALQQTLKIAARDDGAPADFSAPVALLRQNSPVGQIFIMTDQNVAQ
jgi:6-phosphogluconolactonase